MQRKKRWQGEYELKCLWCKKQAIPLEERLEIGYLHGIEHYPLCKKHTRDYIKGEIRYVTASEWKDMKKKKIIVSKSYGNIV